MVNVEYHKLPRIFTPSGLCDQALFAPGADAHHHLFTVLRIREGDHVRIFNDRDGEWLARVTQAGKKGCQLQCIEKLRAQSTPGPERSLVFAPIKKARMDILIEKAVELGVTYLQPVLCANSVVRQLKQDRIEKQIIAAVEQCERLDHPELGELCELELVLRDWPDSTPLFACTARDDTAQPVLPRGDNPAGVLIGPEGGFTDEEMALIDNTACVKRLSLHRNILRSETAAITALGFLNRTHYSA